MHCLLGPLLLGTCTLLLLASSQLRCRNTGVWRLRLGQVSRKIPVRSSLPGSLRSILLMTASAPEGHERMPAGGWGRSAVFIQLLTETSYVQQPWRQVKSISLK